MLTLHILSLIFSVCVVGFADKYALSWVTGKRPLLRERTLVTYHVLTWLGLLSLIVTGIFLALPMLGYLLSQPLFIMKVLFVGVLLVNAILIGRLSEIARTRTYASLSWGERMPLFTSGAVSVVSWSGALILALIVFK